MRSRRNSIINIIVIVCVLVFLGSGFLLFLELRDYRQDRESYNELSAVVASTQESPPEPEEEPTAEIPSASAQEEATPPKVTEAPLLLVDFDLLHELAPDAVAWLTQKDTVINYPVVQGKDNDYYLHHLYDGTVSGAGCLFVDCQNSPDFSDKNSIIYGHNMQDGSMFASLKNYGKQEYYDNYPELLLISPEYIFRVELFAAFTANTAEHGTAASPWNIHWADDAAFEQWLEEMLKRSVIESDVSPGTGDRVLTLSTCAPGETSRFIVMGRLVEQ